MAVYGQGSRGGRCDIQRFDDGPGKGPGHSESLQHVLGQEF